MIWHLDSDFARFSEFTYGGERDEPKGGIDMELTLWLDQSRPGSYWRGAFVPFRVLDPSR
jgi:hypothetical protein